MQENGEGIACGFSKGVVHFRGIVYFDRGGVMQRLFSPVERPNSFPHDAAPAVRTLFYLYSLTECQTANAAGSARTLNPP